jgi:energy-coupling factor transporter ATP-binding protein EcfA2
VAAGAPIISIAGLHVTYAGSDVPALEGVDLEIAGGEAVGVIGLNGAGKTTLALTLNGVVPQLLPADVRGRVTVAGNDATHTPVREMARTVGLVFDNPEFQLSQATVAEEVALGLEGLAVPSEEMPTRIELALEAVGLTGFAERSPLALSGGQQQRVAIAAVLAMEPPVLVMDEPTANLDPAATADTFAIVRMLNRERGMTVIVVEHDVEALATFVDRVVVLDAGRVVREGTPSRVFGAVEALASLGLRSPEVTQVVHALDPHDGDLPVTVATAIDWLEARR